MKVALNITVNGEHHLLEIEPRRTLLEVIREDLGLTGAKEGCGAGECGACTVLLNGRPVDSCLVLAPQADGAEVVTIEGLARDDRPHPLQSAFVENGAVQCGFCTPGMIITSKALLDQSPNAGRDEIKQALAGNFCRCTGYNKIVDAVRICGRASGEKEDFHD
ncbi:MAG: (2Fe-2S)-binding protein [Desulfobacterales bacterium]|nr:(2Fe-2S)-binding protein [Desulfobacterales bacterium]